MHKSKLKGVTLAVLLAFAPLAVDAAGLGRLTVTSGLGEPLSAEIELLSTTPDELASLTAGIASPEAYNVQGVERTAIHNAIKVTVSKRADGSPVLKLTTAQAISDPFLDMLIQVDWATGRLLREYTVLLDPPGYNNQAQVYNGVQLPSGAVASTPAPVATPKPAMPAANTAKREPAPAPVKAKPEASGAEETYMTARGDTLGVIAREHQVQGVSLDQMLVGLYRANEDAFVGKNMNRLKTGQILRVPNASELQQVTPAEATREVKVQTADWNAYRNRLAGLVAEAAPSAEGGAQQSASGRISSPATDQAVPPATGPRDVVKLSSSNADQARLNALQEELTAKEKSLQEASERTAMLEKQIADMQKLLAIKNQSLANLQNADQPAATQEEVENPPAESTPQPQPEPEEVALPAEESAAEENNTETTPAGDVTAPAKPVPQPVPEPVASEPSFFDELTGGDPLPLALGGGAVILLLGGWLYMRNRRKRELDSFEKDILTAGGLKPTTVFGNTAGATVSAGDTSFLNDFSQNTGGMIDTQDVDPIAEAEVYMAYGRDAQAEEILKDAIVKEPGRHELHLKLLEIFASRNDTSAFETVAGEIYTTLGATDPIWGKVATMGRKLEPDNPLYSEDNLTKGVTEEKTATTTPEALQADESEQGDAASAYQPSFDDADLTAAGSFGTEGDTLIADSSTEDESEIEGGSPDSENRELPALDFDLDTLALGNGAIESDATGDTQVDNSLDFTLDLPEPPAENSLQMDIDELDVAIPDFDLPELSGSDKVEETVAEPESATEFFIPEIEEPDTPLQAEETLSATIDTDFSLPEIALPEVELSEPDVEERVATENTLPDIDFDLPEISLTGNEDVDLPEPVASEAGQPLAIPQEDSGLADIQLDEIQDDQAPTFDFAGIDLDTDNSALSETELVASTVEEVDLPDFNFEVDEQDQADVATTAADIDFSGISLDVVDEPASGPQLEAENLVEESADVDTKLDLVTAYMDMGDNEGARELLEEILKEGGPRQKQKAQSILDSLS
ncbi:FimV/HubP family polar landmark protein [Methylobacillus sp.]|uniref:FimV/HubP family polar landmark protein n=1 Tax=Methylobacillus sp. TaxID=56818 RepID=UPI002FE2DB2B